MQQNIIYCLFEKYELQPAELKAIIEEWEERMIDGMNYNTCEQMLKEVEAIGYTFDYGLDAEPYGLRKIGTALNQLENFKD